MAELPDVEAAGSGSAATDAAIELLTAFLRLGVRDIVLSPGSRSQAFALVAADLERLGRIRLHVRVDERGAAYLGLGLTLESGAPTIVITTSGTAVANLHPAVLEAHHAGIPLIVLTADRPAELRGIRSNQTTIQPGIFAGATRWERDVPPTGEDPEAPHGPGWWATLARNAWNAALGRTVSGEPLATPGAGPVHLNIQVREPLSAPSDLDDVADALLPAEGPGSLHDPTTHDDADRLHLRRGPRTVVVAGAGAGDAAEALARAGGWPIFAEVVSGAHFGPNLIVPYRELLRESDVAAGIERVVVFGQPTLSREVPTLVQRPDVEAIAIAPSGIEWYNPGHRVARFARAVDLEAGEPSDQERSWLEQWVRAGRQVLAAGSTDPVRRPSGVGSHQHVVDFEAQRAHVRAGLAAVREPVNRRMLVELVWSATWPHDRLLFGASRLVRDADRVVPGRRIRVFANRGLSGIDGTVATALGVALASQDAGGTSAVGTTRALIGDLTLLHDVGSLLIGDGERRPRIQLIVGNDGGGSIFDALEVATSARPEAFDRVQFTPQHVDLASLAVAYGWQHVLADSRGDLEQALTDGAAGPVIIEVPLTR